MWFSILLLSIACTSVFADIEDELERCSTIVDFEDLDDIQDLDEIDLDDVCSPVLEFFDCVENVVKDNTGFTIQELERFLEGTEMARFVTVLMNIQRTLQELCDKDTQLNQDYRANADCFKTIKGLEEDGLCYKLASTLLETSREFEDEVQEEAGEDEEDDNASCIIAAHHAACAGAEIHEKCGEQAFNTYMRIMKGTTLFKYGICTEDQLVKAKADFFDSVELDSAQRELFNLAFDLKKKKK